MPDVSEIATPVMAPPSTNSCSTVAPNKNSTLRANSEA
jgi:hypothetical protein